MRLHKIILCCLLLTSLFSFAQEKEITGTVTESASGMPIPGANVTVKYTANGVATDFDGKYSITASPTDTLVISYIGFTTQEFLVGNKTTFNVALAENAQALSEVIVVGYGTQKREDITGAVGLVKSEAFDERPNTDLGSLVQGQAAGVKVIKSSGKPSAGFNIRVRGTSSITGSSDPLYVIDGVPTTDTRSLNPSDIESISILKDASSAAIYGAGGANGVVLITTKKGSSEKPVFQFSSYVGVSSVWKTLDVLNAEQYRDLMTEMGKTTDWSQYTNNTDWQNEIFQDAISQNYQLSVSGKQNGTQYYISGGYVNQEGAVRSAEMEKYNFKTNLSKEVTDWLKIGTNINYTVYGDVDVTDNAAVNQGGVLLGVLATPPNIGIYNENGTFTSNPFQDWENPYSSTDGSDRGYKNQRLLGNVYTEFRFVKDLKFKSNFGIDYNADRYDYFLDPFRTSYGRATNGIGRYNTNINNYFIWDNTLSYKKQFGDHKIEALAGTVYQKYRWEYSSIERRNFASAEITTPGAGSEIITANAGKSEAANASILARLVYDYKNKYLLTANFRRDGSSKFGPNKKWGNFPSVSVGWRISNESFLENVEELTELKLRAGYGAVGNDNIATYAYLARVGSGGNYPIGGTAQPGTYPATIANYDLQWESSNQLNVGLDLRLFDSKISFSVDGYVKTNDNLLLDAPLPTGTGFSSAIQNVGRVQNKGLEFQLNTTTLQKGDFTWETSANISFNRNEVQDLVGQELYDGNVAGRGEVSLIREGEALGTFYGYVWGGVDPQTGDVYYIDQNGESTFNPTADDRTIIGNANPDFTYSLGNTLSYKNFGLNIFLQGSQGNDIFNATRVNMEGMIDSKNQFTSVLDRWQNPGDVTDIPRVLEGDIRNSLASDRYVEDGSYLRFKAVTLSYNLPKTFLEKVKLTTFKLYVTGENLITITDYSGFDPEVNAFGGSNTVQGVDFGTYPQTRNIIFGMNLTF
ncbi:TonB-linked outer membrane protein, SusC/RagA family [Pustulibacterium marinum]|uniref:TonB-linked outer membrane protein, SusC/RagA family n=1 Tax=Pustulibacterium marinum TaxID=1224947 RepID=A0A1I7G0A0_9FLAO|nr:TonB-dependent receptor [Pustulibacterium marinum]SFU41879.1 TonB-linked outer membrane protein, SusC/RagA family [Pustulibacterium marinum]